MAYKEYFAMLKDNRVEKGRQPSFLITQRGFYAA